MKEWRVFYTVRLWDGEEAAEVFTVETPEEGTIQDALDEAFRDLVALECENEEISETIVTGIYAAEEELQEAV